MSLGTIFVNSKRLEPNPEATSREFDILMEFVESLVRDPEASMPALQIVGTELLGGIRDFATTYYEKLRLADGKVRFLFRTYTDIFGRLIEGLDDGVVESIPAILTAIKELLQQAKSRSVTALLRSAIGLVRDDFGITPETIKSLLNELVNRVIVKLQERLLSGDSSREATTLYEFGSQIDSLQILINEEIEMGTIDFNAITSAVEALWQEHKLDDNLDTIIRVLDTADDLVEALADLAAIILNGELSISGNLSVGAAANSTIEIDTGEDKEEGDVHAWYASWVANKSVYYSPNTSEPLNIYNNRYLEGFDYSHISKESMEKLAFHSAWCFPILEAFFHILSMEKRDWVANLVQVGLNGIDASVIGGAKYKFHPAVYWTVKPAGSILGALEDVRAVESCNDAYYFVNMLGDLGEMFYWRKWVWLMREGLLSFCTLLNHSPSGWASYKEEKDRLVDNGSLSELELAEYEFVKSNHNHNHFSGMANCISELGAFMLPGILSHTNKRDYGFIPGFISAFQIGTFVPHYVITHVFTYVGGLLLPAIPAGQLLDNWDKYKMLVMKERLYGDLAWEGSAADKTWVFFRGLASFLMNLVDYLFNTYLCNNKATYGGTFCVLGAANGFAQNYPDGSTIKFSGYQNDAANSPYLLPYASGTTQQCVQNPMGLWSHFPDSEQTYAYDFGPDSGTEILNSRAGIVVGVVDTNQDNSTAAWNGIYILHLNVYAPGSGQGQAAVQLPTQLPTGAAGFFADGVTPIPGFPANPTFADGVTPIPTQFQDSFGLPGATSANTPPAVAPTATNIPNGTLFPPYWDNAGNLVLGFLPPLHPSGAILPAPIPAPTGPTAATDYDYSGVAGFAAGTTFDFITPGPDVALPGKTFPATTNFADGTAMPAGVVFEPDIQLDGAGAIPTGTPAYPAGTTFVPLNGYTIPPNFRPTGVTWPSPPPGVPNPSLAGNYLPLTHTVGVYGHALFGFTQRSTANPNLFGPTGTYTDVFDTNNINLILGRFVPQGQVIMLSGDTGTSAYDHSHHHIIPHLHAGNNRPGFAANWSFNNATTHGRWTIPFLYRDATHTIEHGLWKSHYKDGLCTAMTYYTSQNTRVGP